MKKSTILILIITALSGCSKPSKEATIIGEIKGLTTDTLYLYGMDEVFDRIDTIFAEDGKFTYAAPVDTVTSAFLLINNRTEYPLFIDKSNKINVKGDMGSSDVLTIDGNIYNREFTAFQKELEGLGSPTQQAVRQKAEEFIRQHPSSFVSIYLLDHYFVQDEAPDFKLIKRLVESMSGILQDKRYIEQLNENITQAEKTEVGKYAPYFSLPNAEGTKITRSAEAFKKKNLLINFWASWADSLSNRQSTDELKALYKTYKKSKHIALLGISFDTDKEQWQAAIERDTLDWEQVCDFGGLNSEVAKQYSVGLLPANILLSADGKILSKNLHGEALKKKIEETVAAAEAKEKKENKKKK
ncbi:TlpA disulfide reductase family protein [uncultured Bacteroides sp.]|uniref:TlpA disulfide reductase family protein n=1 Tax=uncultured Bacteroides sp. TaxID=162156 RepID=UPI0025D0D9D1|nr:TlpA disulfide reductase family protein [uncultured Bacteroides sp.]